MVESMCILGNHRNGEVQDTVDEKQNEHEDKVERDRSSLARGLIGIFFLYTLDILCNTFVLLTKMFATRQMHRMKNVISQLTTSLHSREQNPYPRFSHTTSSGSGARVIYIGSLLI